MKTQIVLGRRGKMESEMENEGKTDASAEDKENNK